jgi:multidrug efflux system membrane fusion protein
MATSPSSNGSTHTGPAAQTSARKGSRTIRAWHWLLLVCLIAAGGAYYYYYQQSGGALQQAGEGKKGSGKGGPNAPGRVMPVVAAPTRSKDVQVYLAALGSVTPLATVTVRSRVDGQLVQVLFREGQLVKAGDPLAEIDPRPYQVQLAQAEGQMAKDQALLKNAQADLERYRVLFEQDSVAKMQLDTQASLVRQYEATQKVDQAAIENAKLQLVYCHITAPVSGRLGLRQVDAGNIVRASDQNGLVVITQLQPIAVVFTIPEDNLPGIMKKLQAAQKLPVDAYDRAGKAKLASGVLMTADNQIDSTTGTLKLKAQFANSDLSLFPNQFVNVRMLVDVRRNAAVVPNAAIQRGTPGTFVYVVKSDNSVTVRKVALGPVDGDSIAIDSGLAPGDLVVVDGADRLREGARVELPGHDNASSSNGSPFKGRGGKGRRQGGDGAASAPAT